MAFDKTGYHHLTAQIDDLGIRSTHLYQLLSGTNGLDTLTSDGKCFGNGPRVIVHGMLIESDHNRVDIDGIGIVNQFIGYLCIYFNDSSDQKYRC